MQPLILVAALVVWSVLYRKLAPARLAFIRSLVTIGTFAVLITEFLGIWHGIDRTSIFVFWSLVIAVPVFLWSRFQTEKTKSALQERWTLFTAGCAVVIAIMAGLVALTAVLSPPNSSDTMAYHLPRVIYWIQNRSVEFFPTSYLNQIMLQPVAEYVMLHLYLLSGGDYYTNLVQFTGYAGSIVAVSSIAESMHMDQRAQAVAAVFCATLPNAILQASGAKNDLVLALWLAAAVLFALRWAENRSKTDLVFLSLAAGLALGTKGTAYLFLPPALCGTLLAANRALSRRDWLKTAGGILAGVLLINAPQYSRNYDLSGSVLGYDSAQADGFFRWRNDTLGWKPAVSNALRNLSEQLGARSDAWNHGVFHTVVRIHYWLGIDPQDTGTTWRWSEFGPPRNSNHEANANNRWHLLIIVTAFFAAFVRRERRWLFYSAGSVGGFAAFCFYLKWQPFLSRLELPLFVLAAPLGAMAIRALPPALQTVVCLVLVSNCRLALSENWTRRLTGTPSLMTQSRNAAYFNDLTMWNNRESYLKAVDLVASSKCSLVGIDLTWNHLEYPFQALLLQRNPSVRFVHTGVTNSSAKYAKSGSANPCAVLCIDCVGVEEKAREYMAMGEVHQIGRFLLVMRRG